MDRKKCIGIQIFCKSKSERKQYGLLKKTCFGSKATFGLNLGSYYDYCIPVLLFTVRDYKDKENWVYFYDAECLWRIFKTSFVRKPEESTSKKKMVFVKESSWKQHIGRAEPSWEVVEDDYG